MLTQENFKEGSAVIIEESENETYLGFPEIGTLSMDDSTWAIQRILKTNDTTTIMWADGTLAKTKRMSDYKGQTYSFLTR